MKKTSIISTAIFLASLLLVFNAYSFSLLGSKFKTLEPENGVLSIPIADISDGEAHYFKAKSKNDIMVTFFVIKSSDGVIRAAIDACDVCFRSGKGYEKEGDYMVCTNCGKKFASNRINEVKGGCNPAPLKRKINGENLVISMKDINDNAWYCKYK